MRPLGDVQVHLCLNWSTLKKLLVLQENNLKIVSCDNSITSSVHFFESFHNNPLASFRHWGLQKMLEKSKKSRRNQQDKWYGSNIGENKQDRFESGFKITLRGGLEIG